MRNHNIILFFILPVLVSCAAGAEKAFPAFYVNLQDNPLYLKAGFNPVDIESPDLASDSWRVLNRWTNVILSRSELSGLPGQPEMRKRPFLSPFGRPLQEWTIVIPFTAQFAPPFPGIFLAAIGENWQVYLNGALVRGEMHIDGMRLTRRSSQREVFFPVRNDLFRRGENLLVFRIIGDPSDQTVGFQYSRPYYLADYQYIADANSEVLEFVLIGMYLLVGVYHFLIFLIRREEKYNIFGAVFSFGMGLYYLARTHSIYRLISDTLIVVKLEFFIVFLMIPCLVVFAELLCRGRVSLVSKIYACFVAFLAITQLIFPHPYGSDALIIWQLTGIAAMLWTLVYNLLLPFAAELKGGLGFRASVWNTYPGNLLVGVGIVTLTISVDMLDALLLHYSIGFTRYGMLAFVLSVAVMLARLYGKTRRELAEKITLLENAEDPALGRERLFIRYNLTNREKEVSRLMIAGLGNKEIAERLLISEATVSFYISAIFRKFGIEGKRRSAFLAKFVEP